MNAFYINLESAKTRYSHLQKQIASSSLLFELKRFPAINGKDFTKKNNDLSNGQLGCWLSHLSIIKSSLSNKDNLLIIEDDEFFSPMLNHLIELEHQLNDKEWDILYLDITLVEIEDYLFLARELKERILNNIKPSTLKIPSQFTVYGTHAYVINRKSKEKIYKYLVGNFESGFPIDNILCHGIQSGQISAHIAIPYLTEPGCETINSQINSGNHPLEKDWIDFRKLMSIYSIERDFIDYTNQKIEKTVKDIIINRLNYSPLQKFKPITTNK